MMVKALQWNLWLYNALSTILRATLLYSWCINTYNILQPHLSIEITTINPYQPCLGILGCGTAFAQRLFFLVRCVHAVPGGWSLPALTATRFVNVIGICSVVKWCRLVGLDSMS